MGKWISHISQIQWGRWKIRQSVWNSGKKIQGLPLALCQIQLGRWKIRQSVWNSRKTNSRAPAGTLSGILYLVFILYLCFIFYIYILFYIYTFILYILYFILYIFIFYILCISHASQNTLCIPDVLKKQFSHPGQTSNSYRICKTLQLIRMTIRRWIVMRFTKVTTF